MILTNHILFENKNLIIINKPSGWLSVPSRIGAKDPRPVLGLELENHTKGKIFPVHRLDEETSGVICFAKTSAAQRTLSIYFEKHWVQKTYQAICTGTPPTESSGQWVDVILRGKKRAYISPVGKEAITNWEYVGSLSREESLLLEPQMTSIEDQVKTHSPHLHKFVLKPKTGRAHQLRFQLSHRGMPVLGDSLYASSFELLDGSIALRAIDLNFNTANTPKNELIELMKLQIPEQVSCAGLF